MPMIDMPLEALRKYNGTNVKPSDFDDFWDNSIEEMKNLDGNVEMILADFQVPFASSYHLYFTGIGGSRIHCKCMIPKDIKDKAPAIIKFHGYTMYADEWSTLMRYASLGFVAVAMDCRGQGGLSEDKSGTSGTSLFGHIVRGLSDGKENLAYRRIFLDTAQIAGIVMDMKEVDETKVAVAGGSQGGALTIACAALEPRVNLAIPVYPFLSDYKRVWDMDLAVDAFEGIRDYLRRFDPRHQRVDEIFETLGYIDIQHLAPRIKAKTIMATGLMDTICPPSTQFAAYNKIQSDKDVVLYPDFGHEHLPEWDIIELGYLMDFADIKS